MFGRGFGLLSMIVVGSAQVLQISSLSCRCIQRVSFHGQRFSRQELSLHSKTSSEYVGIPDVYLMSLARAQSAIAGPRPSFFDPYLLVHRGPSFP